MSTEEKVETADAEPGNKPWRFDNVSMRTITFTLNNYTEAECAMIERWSKDVKRILVTKEVGEKGTPHLQGAITFQYPKKGITIRKMFEKRANIQKAIQRDCFIYPVKLDSVMFLDVDNRKQGKRSDLEAIKTMVQEGCKEKELFEAHFGDMVRYGNGVRRYMELCKRRKVERITSGWIEEFVPKSELNTKTQVFKGPSGLGKTEFAKAHFENPLIVSHVDDLKLLSTGDYDGIIFDDFSVTHWPRTAAIHLVDLTECRSINVKYGTAEIPAGTPRIFTCNEWPFPDDPHGAIRRRVTQTDFYVPLFAPTTEVVATTEVS